MHSSRNLNRDHSFSNLVVRKVHQIALDKIVSIPAHMNYKNNKFQNIYYRWRAQLMDDLTRSGWTMAELAERFCLDIDTVRNILFEWRKRENHDL